MVPNHPKKAKGIGTGEIAGFCTKPYVVLSKKNYSEAFKSYEKKHGVQNVEKGS